MFNRLRGWLLKVPVLVALGLIGFYFLFGYLLFPPLAKWGAAKYVARKSGHVLALGEAQFDPLRLTLTLRDLKLTEPHGKPLLSFEELFVDFESRSVIDWASTFADIRLRGPVAQVELRPDGRLNWTAFLDAFRDEEEKPSKPLPRLRIAHMALERGRVEFDDQKVAGGFKTVVTPLTFRLSDLSTLPDDKGAYALSARSQAGTRIRWRGQLALNPVKAKGELALDEVPLSEFWNYVDGRYAVAPPEGKGALRLHYGVGYVDKHFSLALEN
ncbi:MAG: DUF748 domain-containing protein, partial [Desulfobulbaceae bacterium]|nr:DUF748 domain-containing protein [Desulfobulbaceae bacterium]